MIAFKIVRKIGKMLRGGAGEKEIFLGAFCGVLIGFNPVAGLTLALAILITLLLNANVGFALLGVALGKTLSLMLSAASFHTGYFIIHNIGLEGLFAKLANAPVTALMDLNVYAMVGSLPYAIVAAIVFAKSIVAAITKIREQMVKASQHDKIGKAVGNRFSRFLMWLVFGKQKVSTADVLAKESPLLRKSGLILVGSAIGIGLVLEFFLLDLAVKKGLQSAIAAETGAEVNISKAHLSLAGGKLELENLQITDPDKPTHNLVQLDHLAADLSVSDLLRKSYAIDLLSGSVLKRDVLRESPGAIYAKEEKEEAEAPAKEEPDGKSPEAYFAKAQNWKKYGKKACDYLKKRRENAETIAKGEKPKAPKKAAVADARKLGYLKAAADLATDRPSWTVRKIEIVNVRLGGDLPAQTLRGSEFSSHPELNGKPTSLVMTAVDGTEPSLKIVLRFDDAEAPNTLAANLTGIAIGNAIETSADFPVNINDGKADFKAEGQFSTDALDIPFTILVHDLKANVKEGGSVMGMDSSTASEVLGSMEQLEIDGVLGGSLLSPRIGIDYEKLTANMQNALVAAGKKKLANRANAEMDKAKDELKEQAGEELGKLLGGEKGESTENKAKDMLKKIF